MYEDYLQHHGIKGMHWGIRRFQNKDGTSTSAGKARRKKLAKRVAIGVGTAAAVAGTAYAVKRHRDNYVSDDQLKELYRKSNLLSARGTANADWNTFNSKQGQYSRNQLSSIYRADAKSDSQKFHKAVNAKINPRKSTSNVNSSRSRSINVPDISINSDTAKLAIGVGAGIAAKVWEAYKKRR